MNKEKNLRHINELKEMIQEKKPEEPVEEVFGKFCSRHAISMGTCKEYYDQLLAKGEIKKEK